MKSLCLNSFKNGSQSNVQLQGHATLDLFLHIQSSTYDHKILIVCGIKNTEC